jgi:hypothetical protein
VRQAARGRLILEYIHGPRPNFRVGGISRKRTPLSGKTARVCPKQFALGEPGEAAMNVHSHYENLRVARNAPPEVIRAAYKALSQRYHPDRNSGNAEAVRIMSLLNQAYEVLSDPEKRREFDKWLEAEERKWTAAHSSTFKEPEEMRRPDATRQNRRATFSVDWAAVTKTQRRQRRKYSPMSRNSRSAILKTVIAVLGLFLVMHLVTSNA